MPKTKKGVLIKTDVATRIYLFNHLKDTSIIIKEINDKCLFIEESKLDYVREKVQEFKNKYSYEKPKG